jgi:hypothetical protein
MFGLRTLKTAVFITAVISIVLTSAFAIPPNVKVNSDVTSELQNEQQIWISPFDANVVLADWRDFRLGYRRVGIGVSTDGGTTWLDSLFTNTPYIRHSDPCLTGDRFGNYYACLLNYISTEDSSLIVVYKSTDDGTSWSGPVSICDYASPHFEDKQMTAVDRTGGPHDGNYYVSWGRFPNPTRIMFVRSTDGAASFEDTLLIGEPVLYDGEPWSSGNFSMPAVDADGDVHVLWLGYRVVDNYDIYYAIRQTSSTDGGQSFDAERVIVPTTVGYYYVDGDVDVYGAPIIDCDISGGPYNNTMYFAQTQYGGFYFEESIDLDVVVWKSTDKGNTWDGPVMVNDDPMGMDIDQFHPWLVVNQDGVVLLIFYDQRTDPINHYKFDAFFAASFDGGETYIHNMRVSEVSVDPDQLGTKNSDYVPGEFPPSPRAMLSDPVSNQPRAGRIAEYNGIHANHDTVSTIWTDTRNGNQDCYSARFLIPFTQPRLYLPVDDEIVQTEYPSFQWSTCWHESEDSYRLEISADPSFSTVDFIYDGLTDNNFVVTSPVSPSESYSWRVKALRLDGDSTEYSETFSFMGPAQAPSVLSTSPSQNELNVVDSLLITADFDTEMNPLTIDENTFVVHGSRTGLHQGGYGYISGVNRVVFEPFEPFAAGEVVYVTLTTGIESAVGGALSGGYCWSFTVEAASAPAVFARSSVYAVGDAPYCACVADFNNDGYIDLASSNDNSDDASVLLNNGDGTFASSVNYALHDHPEGIACGDFDRDDYIDLAIANRATDSVTILLNQGDGSFSYHTDLIVNDEPFNLVSADLDGDGDIDLATTHKWAKTIEISLNDGNGYFVPDSAYVVDTGLVEICVGDLDNDGDYDMAVAVASLTGDGVIVLLNEGEATFSISEWYYVESAPQSVRMADIDEDSDLDLIVSNRLSSVVSVLKNSGSGTFTAQSTYWADGPVWAAVPADVDGDGDLDIAASAYDYPYRIAILDNDGNGSFYSYTTYATSGAPFAVCPADYDNDGDIDIAATLLGGDAFIVMLNQDAYVCGDADASGDVDIDDVVYLIAYIFSSGPPPDPYESGDADCSVDIDIDDVVYLIAYIFSGGSDPCDPDGDEVPDC